MCSMCEAETPYTLCNNCAAFLPVLPDMSEERAAHLSEVACNEAMLRKETRMRLRVIHVVDFASERVAARVADRRARPEDDVLLYTEEDLL